jgi:hypothetical protein
VSVSLQDISGLLAAIQSAQTLSSLAALSEDVHVAKDACEDAADPMGGCPVDCSSAELQAWNLCQFRASLAAGAIDARRGELESSLSGGTMVLTVSDDVATAPVTPPAGAVAPPAIKGGGVWVLALAAVAGYLWWRWYQ